MNFLDKLRNKFSKRKANKYIAEIPDYLKDPRNYDKIQRALLDTFAGMHSHAEVTDWNNCLTCQNKFLEHKELMVKLGFKSMRHYYHWKRVMDVMTGKETRKVPVYDYRKDILAEHGK